MNKKVKLRGKLLRYTQVVFFLGILLLLMTIGLFVIDIQAGILGLGFSVIYWLIMLSVMFHDRPKLVNDLISFATNYGQVQRQLLYDFTIPYALVDNDGHFIWWNNKFSETVDSDKLYGKSIFGITNKITKENLPLEDVKEQTLEIQMGDKDYKVVMHQITLDGLNDTSIVDSTEPTSTLIAVYFFDVTKINALEKYNKNQRLVVALMDLDNYDEALESVEAVRRSLLIALVDRKINKYFSDLDGIVKKIEKDKYFVIIKQKELEQLQEDKFSILDEVKKVNIGNEMPLTLSIGIGVSDNGYMQSYAYARNSRDLALARGGDQAVVKTAEKNYYYGGKSKQVEKSTRVKARVKAQALREIMETKDKVFIMGHAIGDVDSFGAAVGIFKAARVLNKEAHIVMNEITSSVRPMIECFYGNKDYPEDMFVNSSQAVEIVDSSSVLVVVDVNKPSITECPELLKIVKTVVVLDHHRQGEEVINNAVLSYVEPYASSACEMVAEILQYFNEGVKIRNLEADCLYAGIMIDTNNFMSKAGVRTFEAAAFLRRSGADVARVRKMYREDMATFKAKAQAIQNAEVVEGKYAVAICRNSEVESVTVLGAQVANELLNILGIKASFVLSYSQNKIYISARSVDEVNVQVIMEKLGGGGHQNMAGAQLEGYTLEEGSEILKNVIKNMIKEGEL